jgi:DNA-binding MarR family transcriptional regulator
VESTGFPRGKLWKLWNFAPVSAPGLRQIADTDGKNKKTLAFSDRICYNTLEKGVTVTETRTENLPEELYGVLADLLNRKNNIAVLDSIRGEYGVLNCLYELEDGASAGELCKRLHVVPGRMADILKSLEQKELILRIRMEDDRRVVKAHITDKGRQVSREKREEISKEYEGLFRILGEKDVKELIRLLRIVLSYYPDKT